MNWLQWTLTSYSNYQIENLKPAYKLVERWRQHPPKQLLGWIGVMLTSNFGELYLESGLLRSMIEHLFTFHAMRAPCFGVERRYTTTQDRKHKVARLDTQGRKWGGKRSFWNWVHKPCITFWEWSFFLQSNKPCMTLSEASLLQQSVLESFKVSSILNILVWVYFLWQIIPFIIVKPLFSFLHFHKFQSYHKGHKLMAKRLGMNAFCEQTCWNQRGTPLKLKFVKFVFMFQGHLTYSCILWMPFWRN